MSRKNKYVLQKVLLSTCNKSGRLLSVCGSIMANDPPNGNDLLSLGAVIIVLIELTDS